MLFKSLSKRQHLVAAVLVAVFLFTLLLPGADAYAATKKKKASTAPKSTWQIQNGPQDKKLKAQAANAQILNAVKGGTPETVKKLLVDGANVNLKDPQQNRSLLGWAAFFGRTPVASVLLAYKPDLNAADITGSTALMYAAESGNKDITKLLINAKANLNTKDKNGMTALMRSLKNGKSETALMLINTKPDINATDNSGMTALMHACSNALELGNESIISPILALNPQLNVQDNAGQTALLIATKKGYVPVVKLLLDAKADPNLEDASGNTALDYAYLSGNSKLISMITAAGGK